MHSIVLLTGNHLCHNPRVIKEANALCEVGYSVEVLGGWFDTALKRRDQRLLLESKFQFHPLLDLTEQFASRLLVRLRCRMAKEIHAKFGLESCCQLGYFVQALQKAVHGRKADLFIAHSEQALWAVARLQRQRPGTRSPRIGVDMEDWFSEDLLPEARRHRPLGMLKKLERELLLNAVHTSCTSQAMSEALAREYGCRRPTVVYNAFPWADRVSIDGEFKDRKDRSVPSIHWYSQTIGMDRGLGDLFAALAFLRHDVEIHLRGKPVPGFENWMSGQVPERWRGKIFIHNLVSNDELLSRISEHDVGFAGEIAYCKNKEYTISNKILHYLLGGLVVVASDTVGHLEVAKKSGKGVRIYQSGNPESLAKELNVLLTVTGDLRKSKSAALVAAQKSYCWEKVAPILLSEIEASVGT